MYAIDSGAVEGGIRKINATKFGIAQVRPIEGAFYKGSARGKESIELATSEIDLNKMRVFNSRARESDRIS